MNSRKIRVAVILPSFSIGGTENMVANLVKYIDKNKFEVMVISLSYPMHTHVQRMIEDTGVKICYGMKGKVSFGKLVWRVYQALSAFQPELIHSNMYAYAYAVPYLLTHRVMLLHTVHNKPINEFKDKYKWLIAFLYKRRKAVPVAISHIVEKEMRELYPSLKVIERVYNPVETDKYFMERKKNKCPDIRFITVGRLMKQKNQSLMLRAFAKAHKRVEGIRLELLGDGELREELEGLADSLGIKAAVSFDGNVSNVNRYLAAADVFVLSSDYEGLPLSILEAMASGLPILSTKVGGVADIVTDNGLLVKAGDEAGLADNMVLLAVDYEKRYQMGINSLKNVKQYDSREFIRQYEALYVKYVRLIKNYL